jgi:hypothetical protein
MKLNPSACVKSSAGVPIAWAFLGTQPPRYYICTKLNEIKGPDGSLKALHCEVIYDPFPIESYLHY